MYEPSCSSCLGLHVVCEETSSPVMRSYAHSSFDFRENTISTWGPEYKLSFDIKQIYKRSATQPDTYILHFYTRAYNGALCGDNYFLWDDDSKRLTFGYCVNNVKSTFVYELDRMEWSAIEMGQRLVGESSYEFYIKINGNEVLTRSNSSPLTLTNVRTVIGAKSSAYLHLSDTETRNIEGMFEFTKLF